MNNRQQHYSCISTCATEACSEGPIVIAGTEIFIDVNTKQHNITAELLDMQMRLYEGITGDHVRYVDGQLVKRYNASKKRTRHRNFISIAGALSKKEIDECVKSLAYSEE